MLSTFDIPPGQIQTSAKKGELSFVGVQQGGLNLMVTDSNSRGSVAEGSAFSSGNTNVILLNAFRAGSGVLGEEIAHHFAGNTRSGTFGSLGMAAQDLAADAVNGLDRMTFPAWTVGSGAAKQWRLQTTPDGAMSTVHPWNANIRKNYSRR